MFAILPIGVLIKLKKCFAAIRNRNPNNKGRVIYNKILLKRSISGFQKRLSSLSLNCDLAILFCRLGFFSRLFFIFDLLMPTGFVFPHKTHSKKQARYSSSNEKPALHALHAATIGYSVGYGSSINIFEGTCSEVFEGTPQ